MTQNLIPLAHPADTPVTVTSIELLKIVNEERAKAGESVVRHNVFLSRCKDELDGEPYKIFVESAKGQTPAFEAIEMTQDQCKLVAMRESKSVRRHVLARLKELEAKAAQPQPQVALPHDYITALEHLLESKKAEQLAIAQRDEAIRTKAQIGDRKTATAMATASAATKKANKLEIELDRSRQYATVKRMEMLYHGQRFNWRLLKSASADVGVPPVDVFDANYGKVKAYHADAWMEAYALPIVTNDCMALEQ